MRIFPLLLLLTATPLLAGTTVQETDREFSAAGDFNGDTFPDVLVLDKTSGVYRIGYGSSSGALTFAQGRPSGIGTVSGCAVGKLNGIASDSFAVTTPTANRAQILSPVTTGYTEPRPAQNVGVGAKLLAAFDMPSGPTPTAEDDLASLATQDPVMGTQVRALRSNAGSWMLLNQTDAPEGDVAHGNPLVPAFATRPLFAYISIDGATNGFHGWQMTGAANTEVLTTSGLPAGTDFVAATFEPSRADVIFFTPGQATVRVRRIMPGAPWTFSAEAPFTFSGAIQQLVTVSDATGPKVLARFASGALAIYGYTQSGGFSAPTPITPSGAAGLLSGLVPMPGNSFQLLFAPSAGAASATSVTFKNGTSGWTQTAVTALSPYRPLAASANLLLLANMPFRATNVSLIRAYRAADWTTAVSIGGGPISVNTLSGNYGGAVVGIGSSSGQTLGTAASAPGGTAINQQQAQFSVFSYLHTLGSAIEDVTIAPDSGTFATGVQITFTGISAGSTVLFRRSASAPFAAWSPAAPPWIFSPTTVDYHVRTSAGLTSPTRSARYEFSKSPALQDQDGDGVPDFVEIARGLNPAGGPDSDGDGFSDRDEIAANTDPNNAASKPSAAAPALNTMLVDVSASLQNASGSSTGTPKNGTAITLSDPFGNAVGTATVEPPSSAGPAADFSRVNAVGILPELQYLVARTSEHFDVSPASGNERRGREMIAIIPVTPLDPWSFSSADTGLPVVQSGWSWGGVNWLAGSTNWDFGLGENEGFDANWSAAQLAAEWSTSAAGYTSASWESQFRTATNRGAQPYAKATLTPVSSIVALITGKIIGDQLAARSGIAVDGTLAAFDQILTPVFQGLRQADPVHPAAPTFRVQSLVQAVDLAVALDLMDPGAVALRKISRVVYARHQALSPTDLALLPMPLTALATFVRSGALPVEYTGAAAGFTGADVTAANAKIAALAALATRPVATFFFTTRSVPGPAGLTLVQNSGGTAYALFDTFLAATALPQDLPAGTPLVVSAYTDLPNVAGFPVLEVISLQVSSLPFLTAADSDGDMLADEWELRLFGSLGYDGFASLDGSSYALGQEYLDGTDALSAGSSPLLPPTPMRFTAFQLALESGVPRLRARWPAAYADFVTVSFDTSADLINWSDNPAFSGIHIGNGDFVRNVTFTATKGFYRAHPRLKR